MSNEARVGFVGLGFMGRGMAACILAAGHPLAVTGRRNRAPVEGLLAKGAREVADAATLARESDVVVLCVTGSPQVEDVARGDRGLLAGARAGLTIVDCTTADPTSTERLAAEFAARGAHFVDAPLGGTPAHAETGALSAMVGATDEGFAAAAPVIGRFAAKIERIGPPGAGHRMKLLNNFLSLGYAAIYSEALALAAKSGIAPETFDRAIRGGRMDCGFYRTFFDYVVGGNPEAHKFTIANAYKDLRYLAAMADAAGVANPVGTAAKNSFALAVGLGKAERYVPTLSDVVAEANGAKLR
ncbi:MAG: NAD(P)-dependent oxidoreductase [Hyphomicrobiales bacterium]|nr:NAD(P)-dependent oxidoreductase [Hyphomicrobiales bacterium]